MNARPMLLSLVASLLSALPLIAQQPAAPTAVVPRLIRFAGSVRDASGKPMSGVAGITFALFKEQEGGAALWQETQNVPLDASGRYSVLLGATKEEGVPMELFTSGEAQWLGVRVEGQAEQPRVLLVSVPYALKAADADTVGGLPPSAFALAGSAASIAPATSSSPAMTSVVPATSMTVTTPGSALPGEVPKFDSISDIVGSQIFDIGGKIGIGNQNPLSRLDVSGGGIFRGVLQLPATGLASAGSPAGFPSQPLETVASTWNSSTLAAINQRFRWQAEPLNSNTVSPAGTLNLLFASGTGTPVETGLKISNKGLITFAKGQTLPSVTGNEVVSGNVSASQLISTVANGTPPLSVTSKTLVPNLNAGMLGGFNASAFARLATANTFTGNQIIQRLDSSGNGIVNAILNTSTTGGSFSIYAAQSSTGVDAVMYADGLGVGPLGTPGGYYGMFSNHPMGLFTNNVERMRITAAGDVAVGTTFPGSARLTVLGASTFPALDGENGVEVDGGNGDSSGATASAGGDAVRGFGGGGHSSATDLGADGVGGFFQGGTGSNFGEGVLVFPGSGLAGTFNGDVNVNGTLSAGVKNFKIDHPLDPANRYLVHSSVESSEMMNIYTGNVILDSRGRATVELPTWFSAINGDFRYQLTSIGAPGPGLYVAEEIANNRFSIAGGSPGAKVSWQVTAVRHDAFAKAHPLVVEQAKNARDRGYYLHPELYGAPEEKQLEWAHHPEIMRKAQAVRRRQLANAAKNASSTPR